MGNHKHKERMATGYEYTPWSGEVKQGLWQEYTKVPAGTPGTPQQPIGTGNFGEVWAATCNATGRDVAVKVMKPSCNREEALKELDMLTQARHPRVIRLIDVYESPDGRQLSVVMERAMGGDFFEKIMDDGPFQPQDACKLMVLLVEALIGLHKLGVAHRDIKLENLLLMTEGGDPFDFRVCDMGGAKWFPEGHSSITHTEIGTKGYCAPEAYKRRTWDTLNYDAFKVDVYSLGVVVYILLCGYPPWDLIKTDPHHRPNPVKFRTQHAKSSPWDGVPAEAQDLLTRMLTPDVTERITLEDILSHPWVKPEDLRVWCPTTARSLSGDIRPPVEVDLELEPHEFKVEVWQNQRYRLGDQRWDAPYTRGSWTDDGGLVVYAAHEDPDTQAAVLDGADPDIPPCVFRIPQEESVESSAPGSPVEVAADQAGTVVEAELEGRSASPLQAVLKCPICPGREFQGRLVEYAGKGVQEEWVYATAWTGHTWYAEPSWRAFVRRRKWYLAVRHKCDDAEPERVSGVSGEGIVLGGGPISSKNTAVPGATPVVHGINCGATGCHLGSE